MNNVQHSQQTDEPVYQFFDVEIFLQRLAAQGVLLWAEGDKLRYRAAKEVLTPERLGELKTYKTALLRFLQQEGLYAPLSYGQQALWFLQQSDPESVAYHIPVPIRLHITPLDVVKLKESLQRVVARHPMLRTIFTSYEGKPLQKILHTAPLDWVEIDASEWQEAKVLEAVEREAQQPFALDRKPAVRARLFLRGNQAAVLLLCVHHLLCDDWSTQIILEELQSDYTQTSATQTSAIATPLPAVERQYTDYIHWQNELLSREGSPLAHYWQRQLAGASILNLPTDFPRPAMLKERGATYPFPLTAELTQQLKALARREGVTLYTLLLSAFAVLLYRYSDQTDILIGSPTSASRSQPEFARTVGYFVNPIVLRANLSGNPTFKGFLHQMRQTVLEGLANQAYPFPLLVKQLQPERDASRSPLFQTMFVFQNLRLDKALATAQVDPHSFPPPFEVFETPQMEGQCDLIMVMEEAHSTGNLLVSIKYHSDLFQPTTIARMATHWQTLLTDLVAVSPLGEALGVDTPITHLCLLASAERQQLLVDWNATLRPLPSPLAFHQLFERQATQTPDAPAVVFVGEQSEPTSLAQPTCLSYQALDQRANQLADLLRRHGVGPDQIVGVYAERSLELIVALLGIFKAGAAYLPLDPAYPPDRLDFMLQDAHVSLVVTQPHLLSCLPASAQQAHTLVLEPTWQILEADRTLTGRCLTGAPDRSLLDEDTNLAYVIYTSGSTGKPKGVLLEQGGLTNLALAQSRIFAVQPTSRVLQVASLNFDASISEIAMTLCCGATLYLAPQADLLPGYPLARLLQEHAITHVTLTPSALAVLPPDAFPNLASLIVAGEACSADLVNRWAKGRRFFNAYGPTEITVCATIMDCSDTPYADGIQPPPIGRPIDNVQIYVLDSHRQPVPIGVPGELYVGGVGVARGYLNQPALTEERFIEMEVPTSQRVLKQKLYKTGDLVRYLSDGNLEFLGRIDQQVKLRGYRIELGEIEAQLKSHPSIQDAVVVVQGEDVARRLVAYLIADPLHRDIHRDQTLSEGDWRGYLQAKLPEYMLPSAYIVLDALPLTPNGKVDRRLLATIREGRSSLPEASQQQDISPRIPPRTESEKRLAALWAEVLQLSPEQAASMSIHQNFFALGGHSLLAVRLLSRIEECFGQRLSIATLLQKATLEQMAAALTDAAQPDAPQPVWSPLVVIQSAIQPTSHPPFFCIHPVGGHVLGYRALSQALGSVQPLYGLQAVGLEPGQTPLTTIQEMATYYRAAIQQVQPVGPYYLIGWSLGGVIAFEMAQQWVEQGETIGLLALIDSYLYSDEAMRQTLAAEVQDDSKLWNDFQTDLNRYSHSSSPPLDRRVLDRGDEGQESADWRAVRQAWQLFRANTLALAAYKPQRYHQPVLLCLADEESETAVDAERDHGWSPIAQGGLTIQSIGGDHYTILQEPQVQKLAEGIKKYDKSCLV